MNLKTCNMWMYRIVWTFNSLSSKQMILMRLEMGWLL